MRRLHCPKSALAMAVTVAGLTALAVGHHALASAAWSSQRGQDIAASVEPKPEPAPANPSAPAELAREGLAKIFQALEKLIESVPQYQMPEIDENGDIILRRKRPDTPMPPAPSSPAPNQPDSRKT